MEFRDYGEKLHIRNTVAPKYLLKLLEKSIYLVCPVKHLLPWCSSEGYTATQDKIYLFESVLNN